MLRRPKHSKIEVVAPKEEEEEEDTAVSECHPETNKIHTVGLQFSLNSAICSLVSIIIVVSVVLCHMSSCQCLMCQVCYFSLL